MTKAESRVGVVHWAGVKRIEISEIAVWCHVAILCVCLNLSAINNIHIHITS
jgi:hypothetical protein